VTEQSSESAARAEWLAGFINGVADAARGARQTTGTESDYGTGYGVGGSLQRRLAEESVARAVAATAALLRARREARRAMLRTALSVGVVIATWLGLLVLDPLGATPRPTEASSAAAVLTDPAAPDESLFLALLGPTSEPERLAILAVLRERAERGALPELGRPPLEQVVVDSTSPEVALAAASVVKILS
jgi:hypothetical protein